MNFKSIIKYILFDTSNSLNSNRNIQAYLEIALLSIILPVLGTFVNPSDIFFLDSGFPWIVIPPLLVALRYGTINGMISLFFIAVGILFFINVKEGSLASFPFPILSGMIVINLIAGEIIESWKKRFHAQAEKNAYMNMRLKQIDNAKHTLQISHDQLENQFVEARLSLKQSLALIQTDLNQLTTSGEKINPLSFVAKKMLVVFSKFTWLEVAGVYAVNSKIGIIERPLVTKGKMPPLTASDDLLTRALKTKKTVSIKQSAYLQSSNKINSPLAAAIPIVDSQEKVWGVLAVKKIQFTEHYQQHIKQLGLIATYLANLLSGMKDQTTLPHWKQIFIEADTALKLVSQQGLDAHLLIYTLPNSKKKAVYCKFIESLSSGLSQRWLVEDKHQHLLVLMPMTSPENHRNFLKKLHQQFAKVFGLSLQKSGIRIQAKYVDSYENSKVLANLIAQTRKR